MTWIDRLTLAVMLSAVTFSLALVLMLQSAHADELVTPQQVRDWISAYAVKYSSPAYPYVELVADAEGIANCESDHFDGAVINDARFGRFGEVGTFQFLPGTRSIFWITPSAAAGFDYWDPEANVAGAVWLLANGYRGHWTCAR